MTAEEKVRLIESGIDVDGALKRFVNNEMLFMTFLKKFPNEEHFANIKPNLDSKNYDEAYKAAHALKGIAGNLGITPAFETVDAMLALMKKKDEVPDFDEEVLNLYYLFEIKYNDAVKVITSLS